MLGPLDDRGPNGQCKHRLDDQWHAVGPVLSVAAEDAHAAAIAPDDEPVAVVLDLESPPRAVRYGARRRRQAGSDEAGGQNSEHRRVLSRPPRSCKSIRRGMAVTLSD